jgi:threonine synthase
MEKIDPAETIVVVVTGNGLKDVASAMKAAGAARVIEPKLEAVKNVLGKDKVHA